MSELPVPISSAQPGDTAGRGSPRSAATVTSWVAVTPLVRPAPASGPVQRAISCCWVRGYLELWVGVMPRLNDAKGGVSQAPPQIPIRASLCWLTSFSLESTALCQLFLGSLG